METVTDREYEGEHKLTWSELTDRVSMERDGVAVDIRGVTKRFTTQQGDTVTALRNVNLSIKEHDFICVVGRSGCGKTTLLNMLAGFEKPSDGEIVAGGVPVTGPSPRRGVVFQKPPLYPWLTVRQNVEFGMKMQGVKASERRKTADHFLDVVGACRRSRSASIRTVGWHAAAGADCTGAGHRPRHHPHGRTVWCA